MKTDNEQFNVGDLVTFEDGSYVGLVVETWWSDYEDEWFITVNWNDGDRTEVPSGEVMVIDGKICPKIIGV